jgi:hypothetical protein
LLALVFEFRHWGIGWTFASYVFLLCGGNLISVFRSIRHSAHTAFTGENMWTGLLLILSWIALCRSHRKTARRVAPAQSHRWIHRGLLAAVALWNPTVFTLAGRLLLPFRGALRKVAPFFTLQAAALALSLYLFSLDSLHLHSVLFQSILLPRYFTFGLLLFLAVEYKPARQEPLMWNLPAFWRGLAFVLAVEAASTQLPLLQGTTTLTRIGASLLLSQLVWPTNLDWNRAHKEILLTAGPIVLCAILSEMSVQLSVTDLPLRIFDPRMHPTGAVFFTFLSGIGWLFSSRP